MCAAENGYFEILLWLRQNKCPWDSLKCNEALFKNHDEIFDWVTNNGYLSPQPRESHGDTKSSDKRYNLSLRDIVNWTKLNCQ